MDKHDDLPLRPGDAEMARRIELAKHMRPECQQPWNEVHPSGRRLLDAVFAFVPIGLRGQVSRTLEARSFGLYSDDQFRRAISSYWVYLKQRLLTGELVAIGRNLATDERGEIAADKFGDAEPDFERDRLTWFDQTFVSVRVAEAGPSMAPHEVTKSKTQVVGLGGVPDKPQRGRPPKHDWPALMACLAEKLAEDGLPGPGEQAELERWATEQMGTDPAESEVRTRVSKAIEARRKMLG